MSLSQIKVNNTQVTTVDAEPTAGSENLVKSGGIFERLVDIVQKETLTIQVAAGRGTSDYQVVAGHTYIAKLISFDELGNAYLYVGDGAPFTELSLNEEVEWTPTTSGVLKIYNPGGQTGNLQLTIESKGNIYSLISEVNDKILPVDIVPTGGSSNPVGSGAVYERLIDIDKLQTLTINVISNRGTSDFYVYSGVKYKVRVLNFGGLGNAFLGTNNAGPYTQLLPNTFVKWTPDTNGFLQIYSPGTATGTPQIEVITVDNLFINLFVNVRHFGAKGDGVTNDVPAIMEAVDYCKESGGTIYFPNGVYALGSKYTNEHFLIIYPNQTFLFDNGATLKRTINAEGHLILVVNDSNATAYNGSKNIVISGGVLDINGYDEEDNPNGLTGYCNAITTSHCGNILIEKCIFRNQTAASHGVGDKSWHYIEINSTKNALVKKCIFEKSNCYESVQLDSAIGNGNVGSNDGTICKDVNINQCVFVNKGNVAIGNHDSGEHTNIRISECVFEGTSNSERGYINFKQQVHCIDIYNNTFRDGVKGVDLEHTSHTDNTIHDNRFENITTTYSGSSIVAYNNFVNGVFTAT